MANQTLTTMVANQNLLKPHEFSVENKYPHKGEDKIRAQDV
jgi:hypothetical protein